MSDSDSEHLDGGSRLRGVPILFGRSSQVKRLMDRIRSQGLLCTSDSDQEQVKVSVDTLVGASRCLLRNRERPQDCGQHFRLQRRLVRSVFRQFCLTRDCVLIDCRTMTLKQTTMN